MRHDVHRRAGFTLIELAMVLALVALVVAIAVPSLNALTGASLRSSAAQLAGTVREAYVRAALTGKVHRLVLDLDGRAFWLEKTDDRFVLPSEREREERARGGSRDDDEDDEEGAGAPPSLGGGPVGIQSVAALLGALQSGGGGGDALSALGFAGARGGFEEDLEKALKRRLRRRARFDPVGDELGRPVRLEHDVRFLRVWTEHHREAVRRGRAEIYFFPVGYTERAVLTLTDDDEGERTLSLVVNPLTARVRITDEAVEVRR